jgi:hypothetical protein
MNPLIKLIFKGHVGSTNSTIKIQELWFWGHEQIQRLLNAF